MKKRMKIVDVLASVALVGVISATALGQVAPPPTPVGVSCPGGTYTTDSGAVVVIKPYTCPTGMRCMNIVIKENGVIIGYAAGCAEIA